MRKAAGTRMKQMTSQDAAIVRQGFVSILGNSSQFADLVYRRLFEVAPEARRLFGADLALQSSKLVAMLSTVVLSAANLDGISRQIAALGNRHRGYGVTSEHYGVLRAVLLWCLERQLGARCDAAQLEAWSRLYDCIVERMEPAAAAD
jgi:hemoglobin-like flavoprotein